MRVYEFSKQYGIPAKELLEMLALGGFKLNSHMSVLPDDAVVFLEKKIKTPAGASLQKEKVQHGASHKTEVLKPVIPEVVTSKDVLKTDSNKQPINKEVMQPVQSTHKVAMPKKPIQQEARVQQVAEKVEPISVASQSHEVKTLPIESMKVGDFAGRTQRPITDVIVVLLRWGIVAAKNHILSADIVGRLARHYGLEAEVKTKEKQEEVHATKKVVRDDLENRLPIVVVIGHVDHGKTSLLDFIRKTRVASREKGGITQHIGAYEATTPQGNIVFIDTPGHEAFSKMRMRGIKVADIAILVVAADDGVMPQTVEAIKHAKAMNVPIVVAINKIDKVEPIRLEAIKRDLVKYDLLPEEWGGSVVVAPISAKTGQGVGQLLDLIVLQSQLMELQANVKGAAAGYVLEAKLEKGHGPVATVILQHGTLRIGDFFTSGNTTGKVNALVNSRGQRILSVGPSIPVLVAGFSQLPNAGDFFEVISKEEFKKTRFQGEHKSQGAERAFVAQGGDINIILKTDTNSSREAILGSLQTLSKRLEKKFTIVHAAVGMVNESDVALASATGASIVAFHVKAEPNALLLAQKNGVILRNYDIIYKLLESLEEIAQGAREVKMVRTKIGEAVVRQLFNIKGLGVIAGCYVKEGRFSRDGSVVVWRGKQKVGEGKIKSLQREKKTVKEVSAGYECGFLVEGFDQWEIDDRAECFIEVAQQPK